MSENKSHGIHIISPYFPSRTETYRGEDAGEKFLKVILEEEKSILKWMKENEKELNLSKEEQLEFQQADHCHICKEKFINKSAPDHSHHLKQIKELLEANKLSLLKIPSIPQVKRQRRLLSLSMHPDKVGPEREEELIMDVTLHTVKSKKFLCSSITCQVMMGTSFSRTLEK